MDALNNILESKATWRGRSLKDRLSYLAHEIHVHHPRYVRAIKEIERVIDRSRSEERGQCVLVLAESGGGKSTMVRELKRLYPRDDSGMVSKVPAVEFSVPLSITQNALGEALLYALGDPIHERGKADEKLQRAIVLMHKTGTQLICIDNAHDIVERRTSGGVMQIANWIRDLVDGSKCVVLLFGTPLAKKITQTNSQLRRRGTKQIELPRFTIKAKKGGLERFSRFLYEYDKKLPLAELSGLHKNDMARRLHSATNGVIGNLHDLVAEALIVVDKQGREQITMDDLRFAFRAKFIDAGRCLNPFIIGGEVRPLNLPGEPYYNWYDSSNPELNPDEDEL